jgi:hypothetical protein
MSVYYVIRPFDLSLSNRVPEQPFEVREFGDLPEDYEDKYEVLGQYPTPKQAFNLATQCNLHVDLLVSKDDYANAAAQNACNLGAFIHAFDRVILKLQYEARLFERGTEWINRHPICRLYAEQIFFLTGSRDWKEATEYCGKRSGKSST